MENGSQKNERRREERRASGTNYHARESYLQTMRDLLADDEYTPKVSDDQKIDAYFLYEKRISHDLQKRLERMAT